MNSGYVKLIKILMLKSTLCIILSEPVSQEHLTVSTFSKRWEVWFWDFTFIHMKRVYFWVGFAAWIFQWENEMIILGILLDGVIFYFWVRYIFLKGGLAGGEKRERYRAADRG